MPELWHPDTGKIELASVYRQADGRTTVLLRLDSAGSVFVVFRKSTDSADAMVSFQCTDSNGKQKQPPQIQRASYCAMFDHRLSVDATAQVAELVKSGTLDRLVRTSVPATNLPTVLAVEYTLDGKTMRAVVREFYWLHLGEDMRNASLFELSKPSAAPAIPSGESHQSLAQPADRRPEVASGETIHLDDV